MAIPDSWAGFLCITHPFAGRQRSTSTPCYPSTCMYKAYRQRSRWARIKLFIHIALTLTSVEVAITFLFCVRLRKKTNLNCVRSALITTVFLTITSKIYFFCLAFKLKCLSYKTTDENINYSTSLSKLYFKLFLTIQIREPQSNSLNAL